MSAKNDTSYLEKHGNKYRVTFGVPKDLHDELGARLKRGLNTDSLIRANQLKHAVLREFEALITRTRAIKAGDRNALMREALDIANYRKGMTEEEDADLMRQLAARSYEILGSPLREVVDSEGYSHLVYSPEKETVLKDYKRVASGRATPIRVAYDDYINLLTSKKKLKRRTIDDDKRALATFDRWRQKKSIQDDLKVITSKLAKTFTEDLATFEGAIQPITCSKYVTRLRQYWQHLVYAEIVSDNPWETVRVDFPEHEEDDELKERAFLDDEVRRLLVGQCTPHLRDLMYIAALTGARLDAIVDLKVKDCNRGRFHFKRQKREMKRRRIPIHSDLKEIVERRLAGRGAEDWMFPEFPPPINPDSIKEHSAHASMAFTHYRRRIGVDHIVEGKRRSLVNFHSFRRWFITKAERAGQNKDVIAAVVGHKRGGLTFDLYSEGPLMEQAKLVVEAVQLPPLGDEYVPEPEGVTSGGA